MEILCKCGHSMENHNNHGCQFIIGKIYDEPYAYFPVPCSCRLSKEAVEAIYWWDFYQKEVYRLRNEFIAEDRCPDCQGDLRKEEVGLPDNTTAFVYRCYSCGKVWSYYGKEIQGE
jgi:hypothetical protein